MKKKKFTLITASLIFAGLLAFSGCGKKDPNTVYEEASQKTAALKSIQAKCDIKMTLSSDGQSMDMTYAMDSKMSGIGTDKMLAAMDMTVDMLGQSLPMTSYYKDGYYYVDSGSSKMKYAMDIADMEKQLASSSIKTDLTKEDFKEISMEKKDKEYHLTYTLKGDSMSEMANSAMGPLGSMVDSAGVKMDMGDIPGTMTVNKDGYISAMTMKMPVTVTVSGQEMTMDMDMNVTYENPGQDVTPDIPEDLEGYEEIDPNDAGIAGTGGTDGAAGTDVTTGTDVTAGADATAGADVTAGTDVTTGADATDGADVTAGADITAGADFTDGTDDAADDAA